MGAFNEMHDAELRKEANQLYYLSMIEPETHGLIILDMLKKFDPENIESFYPMYYLLVSALTPLSITPERIMKLYDREIYLTVRSPIKNDISNKKPNTRNSK
jgi:hypothetical protein